MSRTFAIVVAMAAAALWRTDAAEPVRELPPLPPFLEVFQSVHQVTIATKPVEWPTATGKSRGLLARADDHETLPAVIVLAEDAENAFFRRVAGELASIGYAALVVELPPTPSPAGARERVLASLTASVRWLRRRQDVFPDRIGVIGWSAAAPWAVELAADQHLQACVVCDSRLPHPLPPALGGQLGETSILLVNGTAGQSPAAAELLTQFEQWFAAAGIDHRQLSYDKARPGFMDPAVKDAFDGPAADGAWFEIYEFLGRHVEDADVKRLLAARAASSSRPQKELASIADLMRTVNAPTGVRGRLATMLSAGTADEAAWKQVGSQAALLAETGELLSSRQPPQGTTASWLRHTAAYQDAAVSLSAAAAARDLPASRAALLRINNTCGECHLDHR